MTLVAAGVLYLALGFLLWVHAWAEGATTHTLCGCGDPALFLWFFQWPATALAHGQNPFFSSALFHPTGINLLAQTSVTGLSLPLVPVTWIWGPVASLNVASTITPALTAFTAFVVIRRWVPWTPAAFVGGLLYGFSPFVLSNLEFAHLMTAALMLLPLILGVLDEILVRQRHGALGAGIVLALLLFAQFFLSSELLAIVAVVAVVCVFALVAAALVTDPGAVRARLPHAATGLAIGLGLGLVLLAWPVWFALKGPGQPLRAGLAERRGDRWLHPLELRDDRVPAPVQCLLPARRLRGHPTRLCRLRGVEFPRRHGGGLGDLLAGPPPVVLRLRSGRLCDLLARRTTGAAGAGLDLHPHPGGRERH